MTTTHTPGPWAVNPIKAQVDAFATGDPVAVCQMLWPTEERTEAETEANGRLVAAAPDMLAALKRSAAILQMAASDGKKPSINNLNGIVTLVREAIAKAERTTP